MTVIPLNTRNKKKAGLATGLFAFVERQPGEIKPLKRPDGVSSTSRQSFQIPG
jgi:hypothetical protein